MALTYPPPRTTSLKAGPCGAAGSTRGANVTTLMAGSTITVKWDETIDHPGHYRISFDTDGQDFIVPLTANDSTMGLENVVADLIMDIQGAPLPDAPRPYTFDVTLPNIECTNCTLQLIQMMTDKPPYTTDAASNDIYYQCADITLVANAPDAGTGSMPDAGMDEGGSNNPGNGEISSGCSTGNPTGIGALALLGLVGLRRRRR